MLRGFSVRGGGGGDDSGGERSGFERRGDSGGGDREMREVKASAALRRLALDGENEAANNDGDDGGDVEGIDEEISEIVSFGGGRTGSNGSGGGGGSGGSGGGGSAGGGAGGAGGAGGSGGDASGSTEVFVVTTDAFFAAQAASIDAAVAAVDDDEDDDDGMIAGVGSSTSLGGSGGMGAPAAAANAAAAAGSDHGAGSDANSPYDATRVINGIDLTKFFRWVTCICVVTFDLELGQGIWRFSARPPPDSISSPGPPCCPVDPGSCVASHRERLPAHRADRPRKGQHVRAWRSGTAGGQADGRGRAGKRAADPLIDVAADAMPLP